MQRRIFWFILILFMGLILNGCGGGDKEESDSITFISDSTIYVKESEIKKFEFPVQATSKLKSKLGFQLEGEDGKFFKLNTENGILTFNTYYYNRGETKSTYYIDVVAYVVEGTIINSTTTVLHKKTSKISETQRITIIMGEKPTPVVVVPVRTPTPKPTLIPTSKTMTKGYLIDAPIAGVNYSCGIKSNLIRGKTTLIGEFSCEVTPVVFSIGDYFLGTLNEFTLDSKVYPQDLLEISRDNFNDTRLIKMIRLLQSLDDDGDISDVITISSRVADKFKEYTNEFDLETLVSLADKELISENDALLHLRANIPTPTPTPYVPTPTLTPYVPTPTPTPYIPTPTPTPYIPTPTPVNQSPIANAGADISTTVNQSITIRGSGSDSDGRVIRYEWKNGSKVLSTTDTFEYLPTVVGIDILTLTVTDDDGATDVDNIIVTVYDIVASVSYKWVTPTKSICESNGGTYNRHNQNENQCMVSWEDAKMICSTIGGELPTIEILRNIVSNCGGVINDGINNEKNELYQACYEKKGFNSETYWSSTRRASDSTHVWAVSFYYGDDMWYGGTYNPYVRCIMSSEIRTD